MPNADAATLPRFELHGTTVLPSATGQTDAAVVAVAAGWTSAVAAVHCRAN